jgi:Uri superfamily endonuclease
MVEVTSTVHGDSLTREPGTYALVLASATARTIQIGKLGDLVVEPGFYVYVGSATGPGGLRARVARHLRESKRIHWHIDYLRGVTSLEEVWLITQVGGTEHLWATALGNMPGASVPLPGFGSSDCRCLSHLFYFAFSPDVREFPASLSLGIYTVRASDPSP